MIKKTFISALVLSLLTVILSPAPVIAGDGLIISENSAEADFPLELNFSLSAGSDVDIEDIRLHYIIESAGFAEVTSEVYIDFVPDTAVDTSYTLDITKLGGLPPGATVEYWWTVADTGGDEVQTPPTTIIFDDNRYSWQSLTEGMVTIYWYDGDQSFAEELMSAARQALEQLGEDTGAYLKKPVKIYIYGSNQDLMGAMIYPQEWTGGVNYFTYSIIAIGIPTYKLEWGKRAIAHELTHQVTYQVTMNPYNTMPYWLNEGLAMYSEGPLELFFESQLLNAIAQDTLISVRSLSSPFSAYSSEAYLSYAQSYSIAEFLITTFGQEKMLELLNAYSEGSSYDGSLEAVYGCDMDGLDTMWREYLAAKYPSSEEATTVQADEEIPLTLIAVSIILGAVILLLPTLLFVRRRKQPPFP